MINYFILYVRDQERSTRFYQNILNLEPRLNVPGMTEFQLSADCILGLMPEKGIKLLLGASIEDPEKTNGISRSEVYLLVSEPLQFISRAKVAGGRVLSELEERSWGHKAGYIADPDGHVVAFASQI